MQPHRYDAVLSDISGHDIEVHGNDPGRAIRCVRNWLSAHRSPIESPLLGAVAMLGDYRRFQADVAALLAARRLDPLDELSHNDFLFTVRDWMTTRASPNA
jgi:hypothetical protein